MVSTPNIFGLLHLLDDGAVHSKEALAQALKTSVALIDNKIHDLQHHYGLALRALPNNRYQLQQPFEWLNEKAIHTSLSAAARRAFTISLVNTLTSSNTVLKTLWPTTNQSGLVLGSEWQSACRGRMQRKWQVALGSSLSFSVLWHFREGISAISGMTLATGVAVIRALRQLKIAAQLKWPNDIMLNQQKMGGILVETTHTPVDGTSAILGIGLNTGPNHPEHTASCHIASRNRLLAHILNALYEVLTVLSQHGFAYFQQEWEASCMHLHLPVRLIEPNGQTVEGITQGVSEQGALLLQTHQGINTYHVGEISLRMLS